MQHQVFSSLIDHLKHNICNNAVRKILYFYTTLIYIKFKIINTSLYIISIQIQ